MDYIAMTLSDGGGLTAASQIADKVSKVLAFGGGF